MKTIIFTFAVLASTQILPNEHALGAHEHGAIIVGMAVEKNIVEIDIDGPAESFLGFEYAPKTTKEKKIFSDLEAKWTKDLKSFFAFDKKLNCTVTQASFEQIIEKGHHVSKKEKGIHSDIEAKAKVICSGDLSGSEVTVSLKKTFKNIKTLAVEIIGAETKRIEITKAVQTFKI